MKHLFEEYRASWTDVLAVFTVVALAVALRLHGLDATELWWDEFLTLHRARLPLAALWDSLNTQAAFEAATDTSPPLHHAIIHFFLMAGRTEGVVKLASVLAGTGSIALLYVVGRRFFGRLAGFLAALYAAVLLYHMAYSRDLRWYPFFFCFSLASLWFCSRCLSRGRFRDYAGWVAASAAMLYTSYVALMFLAGQALFVAIVCLAERGCRQPGRGLGRLLRFAAAGAVLAAIYLPQMPGHLVTTFVFYQPGTNPASVSVLWDALAAYAALWSEAGAWYAAAAAAVALAGIVLAVRRGRGMAVLCLLLWAGVPTAMAFAINVSAVAQAKYFPGLFLALLLLVGLGLATLAQWAAAILGGSAGLATVLGVAGVVSLAWPNIAKYDEFYQGMPPTSKVWARHLALTRDGADALLLQRSRQRKVILEWYLGETYPFLSDLPGPAYRRFAFVGDAAPPPEAFHLERLLRRQNETVSFWRGGVASDAPIPLAPRDSGRDSFQEDFGGLGLWRRAAAVDNLAPDFSTGRLALASFDRPGRVVYAFANPTRTPIRRATLTLDLTLLDKVRRYRPDASVRISVSGADERWTTIGKADISTFVAANPGLADPEATGRFSATVAYALPEAVTAGETFQVCLEFVPGHYSAAIEVDNLALDVAFDDASGGGSFPTGRFRCANLLQNTPLLPYRPGVRPLEGHGLYAFCPHGPVSEAPCGTAAQLAAFVDEYPDLLPVVIVDPNGEEACRVYDPLLPRADVAVAPGRPLTLALEGDGSATFRGLRLAGEISRPKLRIGDQAVSLPVAAPKGAVLRLNPGDKGLVTFEVPTDHGGFTEENMIRHENMALPIPDGAVTCKDGGKACAFAYLFASELPITDVRLVATPSVSPGGRDFVRAYYAVNDPEAKQDLFLFKGKGRGRWESAEALQATARLPRATFLLYVGFELSGDGANVRAAPDMPLLIEVGLDARALPVPTVEGPEFRVEEISRQGNAYRLFLSREPLGFYQRWAR